MIDGDIYNRREWDVPGGDASLLVRLYRSHGFEETLRRINGDFAVALYDPAEKVLWLGRDRFGLKPLYYIREGRRIAFASRPGALLAFPGVSNAPDRRFIALFAGSHYRYFDNDPSGSPFADVRQLPAAHALRFAAGEAEVRPYWRLEEGPAPDGSPEELAGRYRELLSDAVSLRLKAARRPAFTLSGGMDSSSVMACAARLSGRRQHAFSSVYDDKTYDESEEIRPMLDAHAEAWHSVRVDRPDVAGLVRRMVAVHDEPVATATWLSHFMLCEEAAREGFGALFGGLGGDELNAGEYEYFLFHFADLRAAGRERDLSREAGFWARYHDHPVFKKSPAVMEEGLRRLSDPARPGRCLADRGRLARYRSALRPEYYSLESFEPVMDHPFRTCLQNRAYQDIFRETLPCCLRAEDRQTSAFGLGNFLPFLDHRLVEFMFHVPGDMKIRDGTTKHLLRLAMRGILPEETRTRVKKTGWNAPAHLWFSGKGRDLVLDCLRSAPLRDEKVYKEEEVERLLKEHEDIVVSGRPAENHMMFFWQLVNMALWLEWLKSGGGRGRPA